MALSAALSANRSLFIAMPGGNLRPPIWQVSARSSQCAMYRDPKQWAHVRRLILQQGASRRGVSRKTGLSRNTVRKMLACPEPPSRIAPQIAAKEALLGAARSLAAARQSLDPAAYRRRALRLWGRARDLILQMDRPQGASLLREISEATDGITAEPPPNLHLSPNRAGTGALTSQRCGTDLRGDAARAWLDCLLRGEMRLSSLGDLGPAERLIALLERTKDGTLRQRKKAAAVLADLQGIRIRAIAAALCMSRVSVRRYVSVYASGGAEALFASTRWSSGRRAEDEATREAVFALLHEPPSAMASTEPVGEWRT
jgi:hypothetical protein